MANRERKIYMLSKKNVDYIEEIKESKELKYNSEALDLIIREHRNNLNLSTEAMINLIGEKLAEQLKNELRGIKLASNKTDKNTQIIIELINGFFVKSNYRTMASTDEIKADAIDKMTKVIEERIEKQRTKKLDDIY